MRCEEGLCTRTWKLSTHTGNHSVEKSVVAGESIHQEKNDIESENRALDCIIGTHTRRMEIHIDTTKQF